jgi:hypothetical protein
MVATFGLTKMPIRHGQSGERCNLPLTKEANQLMFNPKRSYFYCAFMQKAPGELRYFSGIFEMETSYSSRNFLIELCQKIADNDGSPAIASQLVIQSLTPLD